MDDMHTRISGSLVAHSRYLAAHVDALCLDTLERFLACTRINGSLVAHSRYLAAHVDALCLDTLERFLACTMPIGIHSTAFSKAVAFATEHRANLAVLFPHKGPYSAFEWVLLEKYNGRRPAIVSRLVAHSRMFFSSYLYCFSPRRILLLLLQFQFRQQTCHSTLYTCGPCPP